MPTFISRLMRPFTSSVRLGLNTDSSPITLPEGAKKATIAAGCFWGVEHMFRKEFKGKGLYDARVGYIGGDSKNPSYRAVCSGRTGHKAFKLEWEWKEVEDAEALQVSYDPSQITYRQLLEFFYKMHDPTTKDSQGPDHGTQYRSGIFYHDEEQEAIAREVTELVNAKWWKGKVVTEIVRFQVNDVHDPISRDQQETRNTCEIGSKRRRTIEDPNPTTRLASEACNAPLRFSDRFPLHGSHRSGNAVPIARDRTSRCHTRSERTYSGRIAHSPKPKVIDPTGRLFQPYSGHLRVLGRRCSVHLSRQFDLSVVDPCLLDFESQVPTLPKYPASFGRRLQESGSSQWLPELQEYQWRYGVKVLMIHMADTSERDLLRVSEKENKASRRRHFPVLPKLSKSNRASASPHGGPGPIAAILILSIRRIIPPH
ncbi:hypothetical protein B7494_g11 [Chlorociboria aeruginascens]|nr:hypothetical protein B7494_g11 [Chlorociboria aeruginascens]